MFEVAVVLGVLLPSLRFAVVACAIRREINDSDERCRTGMTAGRVKRREDVEQEYAAVRRATDRLPVLALDLRKWTHRQFFPHGSAR